jgi:hypothetical protein
MNRKVYASLLTLCTCLAVGFLPGCGGSSSNSGGGGTTTTYTVSVAVTPTTVTANGTVSVTATTNDTAGVNWKASCASGASSCGSFSPATSLTGVAVTYTAPAGPDTVTITGTSVTNSAVSGTATVTVTAATTYVYYASGQEASGSYYAVAGAVTLDGTGDITGGEQDYNDGVGVTSLGEPATADTITPATGALVVDPTTGLGTLTMTSSNTAVGVGGVETFAVQFVNANHALIMQFDGSATSSGSLDLQTSTTTTGSFAFAVSGVNPNNDSVAYGGVFTTGATGTIDINDDDGGVSIGNAFTPTATTPDTYGRSVVTGITDVPFSGSPAITFVTYAVGPEAIRIIDVDTTDTAVGSAFGQGSATFNNASLTSDVFTLFGQWSEQYATLGQFTADTNGDGGISSGTADDNELSNGVQVINTSLTGTTYDLTGSTNGYGTVSLIFGTASVDVSSLGLYMTDPALNLNDPNNTTTDLGGGLVADMDPGLPGGIGVITPQTDTTATDFSGNYAAGFQDFNYFAAACGGCEFDMVGPFTMTAGVLSTASIGADTSDPLSTLTGAESTADIYTSTPTAVSPGYFTMAASTTTPPGNPLVGTLNAAAVTQPFNVDIYQASATTLYWIDWDTDSVFLGPIEQQSTATAFPASKKRAARAQAKRK